MNQDIKQSQARLLDMANTIAEILERHDISHSMVYGTFLGAVRHQGFIPWDDDFDFCIFEECYEDAERYLEEELPDDLFLENKKTEPMYFHSWDHVKDLKSEAVNTKYKQDNIYAHKGLSIDLYKMKKVKLGEIVPCVIEQLDIFMKRRQDLGTIDDGELQKNLRRRETRWDVFRAMYPNETEESLNREVYANIYTSLYSMEIDDVFPLKKYRFEDSEFYGPRNADKILRHWYGNSYMELPPEEKRLAHFDSVKFL